MPLSAPPSSPFARFRAETGFTQAVLAETSGVDQSRISRMRKGIRLRPLKWDRLLDALSKFGSKRAGDYRAYAAKEWLHIEPPSFWNPELACLEITEETLGRISEFPCQRRVVPGRCAGRLNVIATLCCVRRHF